MNAKASDLKENSPAVVSCQFTGRSHIKKGKPCQDGFAYGVGYDKTIVMAVSDGVSNSLNSEKAANTAVQSVIEFWKTFHSFFPGSDTQFAALRACMNYALKETENLNNEDREAFGYETTLAIVLICPDAKLYYSYVGDGGIYLLADSGITLLSKDLMREEDGSVQTLSSGPEYWSYGQRDLSDATAVLMVTDGVSDIIRKQCDDYSLAKRFMIAATSSEEYRQVCEQLLGEPAFSGMEDDATFLLYNFRPTVVNDSKTECSPEKTDTAQIETDRPWNEDTVSINIHEPERLTGKILKRLRYLFRGS